MKNGTHTAHRADSYERERTMNQARTRDDDATHRTP